MAQNTLEDRVRLLEDTVAALVAGRAGFDLTVGEGLHRIASLQENWDSEGARSIDPDIIAAAREFVLKLPGRLKSVIRVPTVVPMRKSNLQFEWHDGPRTLELEIDGPHTIHYLKWHADAGIEEEDVLLPVRHRHDHRTARMVRQRVKGRRTRSGICGWRPPGVGVRSGRPQAPALIDGMIGYVIMESNYGLSSPGCFWPGPMEKVMEAHFRCLISHAIVQ